MTNFSPLNAAAADDRGPDDHDDGPALIISLQRQLSLYETLNSLAQRQGALIGVGDGSPLIEMLGQRQRIIDELQALHIEFETKRLRESALTAVQRRTAAELTELIGAIRARILEQDERDRAALREARGQVAGELRKLSHTGSAARAYGSGAALESVAAPRVSRFTDRQG